MRKLLLIAGLAALALPGAALAQDTDMTPEGASPPVAGDYGADVAYSGGPEDLTAREAWLDRRIARNEDADTITDFAAFRDREFLASVRRQQDVLRTDHDGLTLDDRADLNAQLDRLNARIDSQLGEGH
jgi:hypothetical protein